MYIDKIDKNSCITINEAGVFTYKPLQYAGEKIEKMPDSIMLFKTIKRQRPDIKEIQIIASVTDCTANKYVIPSTMFGPNAWCRVVFSDDIVGPWVWLHCYNSAPECAKKCLFDCVKCASLFGQFNNALFDKRVTLIRALQAKDLSAFDKKNLEINGYIIAINKINTK